MVTDETLQQLQRYNFDLLARQELNGQRRMRYMALAHLNYEDIIDACCEAWNQFTQIPNAIRSLYTRNWVNLPSVHRML